jgi:hypothetical protein
VIHQGQDTKQDIGHVENGNMIKLVDILKEVSPTYNVGEIGWNWPYADDETIAKGWEKSRLYHIFTDSLKDWEAVKTHKMGTIMHAHDIDHNDAELAGKVSTDDLVAISGYEFVKNIYDKSNVDMYLDAEPHLDIEKKY